MSVLRSPLVIGTLGLARSVRRLECHPRSTFVIISSLLLGVVGAWAQLPVVPENVKTTVRRRVDNGYCPGIVVGLMNTNGSTCFSSVAFPLTRASILARDQPLGRCSRWTADPRLEKDSKQGMCDLLDTEPPSSPFGSALRLTAFAQGERRTTPGPFDSAFATDDLP